MVVNKAEDRGHNLVTGFISESWKIPVSLCLSECCFPVSLAAVLEYTDILATVYTLRPHSQHPCSLTEAWRDFCPAGTGLVLATK